MRKWAIGAAAKKRSAEPLILDKVAERIETERPAPKKNVQFITPPCRKPVKRANWGSASEKSSAAKKEKKRNGEEKKKGEENE